MRVLHISAGNLFGGVETLLLTLAKHQVLCPRMESHFALCFEGRLAEALRQSSVPVHMLGQVRVSRPWSVWRARRNLTRLLRQVSFETVICHSAWPMAIFGPTVRRHHVSLISWLHDAARGTHWLERWARRTSPDFVVCNSQFTSATLPQLYPGANFDVVHCPVALPDPSRHDRNRIRVELATPADAVVVVQVSRLERWKGHHLHLAALSRLRDLPKWEAWIIGGAQRPHEARYLQELKKRAVDLGIDHRVRFMGYRSDVPRLLSAADIHCQPNTGPEPFGITFVEGLLAGLPVVTTALGGTKEIVDETCGILVPPGDPLALADSLRGLIEDPEVRTRLGSAGPFRARSLCDPGQQLARIHAVCQRALEQRIAA
jgi:glycosyltransferase involved in cell wall biosynthesis